MSMRRYMIVRTLQTIFLLWGVLTFLFFFFRLMPGSIADIFLFQGASPESVQQFEENWGLNDPLHVQYLRFIFNFVQLDLGTSLQFREPVFRFVKMKIFNSIILIVPALTFSYVVGGIIGTILGTNRGERLERYAMVPIIFFGSFPTFFTGIFLVVVFAGWFNIFPSSGMVSPSTVTEFADASWWRMYMSKSFAMHYVLPFSAIVLRYIHLPVLIMRTNVVEILGQDFLTYNRLTGMPAVDRFKNVSKHASLPLITLYPITVTSAIGGLVLIEVVFNWPGIGYTLVQSVFSRDLPVLQFVFFVIAAFVIFANYAVDIIYGLIDPRVSVGE